MYKKIYKEIKKYNTIVIARHIGPDPDALGSQFGLKEIILNTFPNKKVYIVGVKPSKFSYMGYTDDISKINEKESLLIVTDTPDLRRIDGATPKNFKQVIKIDHHPFVDDFKGLEIYDQDKSSASEMIVDLVNNTKLKMNEKAAELLYLGIVADTGRFMYGYTRPDTFRNAAKLVEEYNIDILKIYEILYTRPLNELKMFGYMAENCTETPNGLLYIKITPDILEKYGVDAGSPGNLVSKFKYTKDIHVWATLTEDTNNDNIRVSIRSNGPAVNKVAEKYTGGGHELASGARPKTWEEANKLLEELEDACKIYIAKEGE